jgi:succinylglutamate desuccinylase
MPARIKEAIKSKEGPSARQETRILKYYEGIGDSSESSVPNEFLSVSPERIMDVLGQPSLIKVTGKNSQARPLFVSTLLHGDEHSGLIALQRVLGRSRNCGIERTLLILVGNVQAAAQNKRLLPGQPDFNRIWDSSAARHPEHAIAHRCIEFARQSNIFAALDLHNNTGLNPHYACVANLRKHDLQLARMFSRNIMLFEKPDTTFGAAFAKIAPTITIEAGLSGDERGIEKIQALIESLLRQELLAEAPMEHTDADLYRNQYCVKLRSEFDLRFASALELERGAGQSDDPPADLIAELLLTPSKNPNQIGVAFIREDIDRFNFLEIQRDTPIGRVVTFPSAESTTAQGESKSCFPALFPFEISDYASCAGDTPDSVQSLSSGRPGQRSGSPIKMHLDGTLYLAAGTIPSMLTPKREAVLADCLCYVMQRIPLPNS